RIALGGLENSFNFLRLIEHRLHLLNQPLPLVGKQNRLFGAIEDYSAELFFELLDLHAERGLGHVALLGGLREAPKPMHGKNVFQLSERKIDFGGHISSGKRGQSLAPQDIDKIYNP